MLDRIARAAAAGLFVGIGILHFVRPKPFLKIMPPGLPWPQELVYLSGAAEIAGGIGLLTPWARPASWGLTALLVAVYPANIYHAISGVRLGPMDGPLYHAIRLPLQPLLIAWVLRAGR